jgi:hypothetical protein
LEYFEKIALDSIFPVNGPALRGSTLVTIYGNGFSDEIDISCTFNTTSVPAVYISPQHIRCRAPAHMPGATKLYLSSNGNLLHAYDDAFDFIFLPDASVDQILPNFGYTSGGYPIIVLGTNFVNSTALGCRMGGMHSRGIFLSNTSIICLAPSPLGRPEFKSRTQYLEVTNNGLDFTESFVEFLYSEPCDEGFFCPGMSRQLCPNGTFCPSNSRNFTLCTPGYFQPREGSIGCLVCPIGYICPDQGKCRLSLLISYVPTSI